MFVELLEFLRCPRPHEETPLIVAASRSESRHVISGTLGCPVCHAEFAITDGAAIIDADAPQAVSEPPDADMAMRLAAFLQLTDVSGFIVLHGRWGNHVDPLHAVVDLPAVLVNPAPDTAAEAVIRCNDSLPLAAGVARGAALDAQLSAPLADAIVRGVRVGGRVVGSATLPVPAGVRELVRDERHWVAEKTAAPEHDPAPRLVTLKRAGN